MTDGILRRVLRAPTRELFYLSKGDFYERGGTADLVRYMQNLNRLTASTRLWQWTPSRASHSQMLEARGTRHDSVCR